MRDTFGAHLRAEMAVKRGAREPESLADSNIKSKSDGLTCERRSLKNCSYEVRNNLQTREEGESDRETKR